MIGLIQLVKYAQVRVEDQLIASIKKGLLALIGLEKSDSLQIAEKQLQRILNLRIFPDENGKMNLNLQTVQGGLMLVPQFTLVADTNSGNRPGFSRGMPPSEGEKLFAEFVTYAKNHYRFVEAGQFGAHMEITLLNDGPTTFILENH